MRSGRRGVRGVSTEAEVGRAAAGPGGVVRALFRGLGRSVRWRAPGRRATGARQGGGGGRCGGWANRPLCRWGDVSRARTAGTAARRFTQPGAGEPWGLGMENEELKVSRGGKGGRGKDGWDDAGARELAPGTGGGLR